MSDHDYAVVDPDDADDTYAGWAVPRRLDHGDATKIDDFWTE